MSLAIKEVIKNFAVTREKRAGAFNMTDAHYHDHYEIYFLAKGSVRYFIGDKVFDLNAGDVVLIAPHIIHKTATLKNQGAERVLIAFTNEFIMYPPGDRIFSCFDALHFKEAPVREIVEKAEKEFLRNDRYCEDLVAGYIREILVKLKRIADENRPEELSPNNSIVQSAVRYISDNFASELTLTQLARSFGLSESHFSRQFKMYTGFGVNEYISTVRVKNAEKMLVTTNLPVTQVAQNCGFNSSSYFAAVFKKIRGLSPGEVRKKRREQK